MLPSKRPQRDAAPAAKLVVVHVFGSRPQADVAKTALEAAGIDAMIRADTVGGMRPHLAAMDSGFHLLVREEDAADAREVLRPRPIIVDE